MESIKQLSEAEFTAIRKRAEEIKSKQDATKQMFEALADMYWISETDADSGNSSGAVRYNANAIGDDDVRLTATTSSRDRVVGLHRLMRTTRPQFEVKCENKSYATKIEKALDQWWDANNERRRAKIESELTLSGILFADENLSVNFIDDLLAAGKLTKVRKSRLEKLRQRTPVILEVDSPLVTYPVWGEDGLSEYLIITDITGRKLRERWGVEDIKDDRDYTLYDYWDLERVCTWYEEGKSYLRGGKHGLDELPKFSAVTDGTDLFFEEERKRSPFLYGMWKSGLHKREDETLTSLFTSQFARGSGPLVIIDKSDPSYNPAEIEVSYQGLVRILAAPGKPQLADDKAFDSSLLQLAQMLKNWGEATTIPSQTLGENILPGTPYSGYAMASQNGRIPLVPVQSATEKVIKDAAMFVLSQYRERGIDWEGLKASEILEDIDVTVRLEVDLPQDSFRNAQTLAQLKNAGVPLSNEWMHTFLQIQDSEQMVFDVMSETAAQAAYQQDMPNLIQQMLSMMQPQPPQPGPGLPPGGMPPGGAPPMMDENAMQYPTAPGGPAAAMAGGEVMPATMPQENPNNGLA